MSPDSEPITGIGEGIELLADARRLSDQLRVGIVVIDANMHVLDVNRAALNILGETTDESGALSLRNPLGEVVRADGTPFARDDLPVYITLTTGQDCHDVLMGTSNLQSARRWIIVDTTSAAMADGTVGVVTTFVDVSAAHRGRLALELINAVNHIVMNTRDEDECLQDICEAFITPGNYALAWADVASEDVDGVRVLCSAGASEYLTEGMVSWWGTEESGRGPTGTALRTGTTQTCENLPDKAVKANWRERAAMYGLGSSVALPFTHKSQRACLTVYSTDRYWFDEATVLSLESVVREMSFGLAHVRSIQQLAVAFDGTLAALSEMTERRDPYTAGHQNRVGILSGMIATRLGLDEETVQLIRRSAEVHDIGKVAVPTEILTRPGRLSSVEYDMVKTHCDVGHDILTRAGLPWPIADVAWQHHERANGSGYPRALSNDEICLPARIVAVADVVEAMTNHRPYRPGLGLDEALAEIRVGAGTRYDPLVAQTCLALFDEGFTFDA
jgi:HD-GYP domain-containing protein (c-di-GMP phosphodiesterase class II)